MPDAVEADSGAAEQRSAQRAARDAAPQPAAPASRPRPARPGLLSKSMFIIHDVSPHLAILLQREGPAMGRVAPESMSVFCSLFSQPVGYSMADHADRVVQWCTAATIYRYTGTIARGRELLFVWPRADHRTAAAASLSPTPISRVLRGDKCSALDSIVSRISPPPGLGVTKRRCMCGRKLCINGGMPASNVQEEESR